jgi:hypothetical protein
VEGKFAKEILLGEGFSGVYQKGKDREFKKFFRSGRDRGSILADSEMKKKKLSPGFHLSLSGGRRRINIPL